MWPGLANGMFRPAPPRRAATWWRACPRHRPRLRKLPQRRPSPRSCAAPDKFGRNLGRRLRMMHDVVSDGPSRPSGCDQRGCPRVGRAGLASGVLGQATWGCALHPPHRPRHRSTRHWPAQTPESSGAGKFPDSLAERSKAVAQGAIPKGRGLEPHSCQPSVHE